MINNMIRIRFLLFKRIGQGSQPFVHVHLI